MRLRKICLQLPEYLAQWLEEFSKQLAMTPSQLIANILNYYYEAWKIGKETTYMGETTETIPEKVSPDLERIVEQFLNKNKTIAKLAFIVKNFVSWFSRRGLGIKDINESLIEQFLEEYSLSRNVKGTTKYMYKKVLRRFLEFVKEST
uniref:Core-binding (CB) domain-containing protein n=1 Tax=Ignisphaera aggregans TaxID=334771 RepID=A0A7C4BD80_9CREN